MDTHMPERERPYSDTYDPRQTAHKAGTSEESIKLFTQQSKQALNGVVIVWLAEDYRFPWSLHTTQVPIQDMMYSNTRRGKIDSANGL